MAVVAEEKSRNSAVRNRAPTERISEFMPLPSPSA